MSSVSLLTVFICFYSHTGVSSSNFKYYFIPRQTVPNFLALPHFFVCLLFSCEIETDKKKSSVLLQDKANPLCMGGGHDQDE